MAFRADKAARIGYEQVEAYLVPRPRDANEAERALSKETLLDILDELGPVVDANLEWRLFGMTCRDSTPLPFLSGYGREDYASNAKQICYVNKQKVISDGA